MPTSTTAEMPTQDDCDIVKDCELALLRGAVRGDRTSATLLLHRDFHEFGASGVVWDRESVLDMMEAEAAEGRAAQIRTMDRSERIRTYNFPESRVSDHRIGYKANNLDSVLDGDLEALLAALKEADRARRLEAED